MPPSHILIVDDEPYIRILLGQIFADAEEAGSVTLLEAVNGRDALTKAMSHKPHLIFLDIMMPEGDGLSVCRDLRARPDFAATRIILLTARGQSEDRQKGLAAGADAYITKPFDPDQILQLAESLLGHPLAGG